MSIIEYVMQITRFVAPLKLLGLVFACGLCHVVPMATLSSFRTDFLGTLCVLLLCIGKCLVHFNALRSIGSHHLVAVKEHPYWTPIPSTES